MIGERFIYNPLAVPVTNRTEAASLQRFRSLWQSLYGHQPQAIHSTVSLPSLLNSIAEGLRAGGNSREAAEVARLTTEAGHDSSDLLSLLMGCHHRDKAGEMTPFFRSLAPFALAGAPFNPGPFLVIEDPPLLASQRRTSADPLLIYTTDLGPEVKELLPQV